MASKHDLSWKKASFFAKLSLFFKSHRRTTEEKHFQDFNLAHAIYYSRLSSIYYSIAGTARVKLLSIFGLHGWRALFVPGFLIVWCFTWLPLGGFCYWRMLPLSDYVVANLNGEWNLSPEQCDIRQSILRHRGRLTEAQNCIMHALSKEAKQHTRGLLYVGLADIACWQGNDEEAYVYIKNAEHIAALIATSESEQAARIYRHLAELFSDVGDETAHKRYYEKAEQLENDAEVNDLLKLF
jgi:tetratricopeptide (TPR) repeat protein